MLGNLKLNHLIVAILLFLEVVLGIFVFLYPVLKPVPPGVDAMVYINDVHWLVDNKSVPKPNQNTYHGSSAYVAPMTDLNLALMNILTGLDVVFPLFSVYQIILIVLIVLSSYLIGKIYGRFMSLLLPIAVLASFSLIRLFIGSTVSNLLAFVYMNIIYYLSYRYYLTKKFINIPLIVLVFISLFLTHNYLSAPVFTSVFILYALILLIVDKHLRSYVKSSLLSINKYLRTAGIVIIVALLAYLFIIYLPVFKEAKNAFWQNTVTSKFRGAVPISQYSTYLGPIVYFFATLGILFYVLHFKKNVLSYRSLPLLFTLALLILMQTSSLGINFFYERLVFLAAIVVALFSVYFITHVAIRFSNSRYKMVVMALFVVMVIPSGVIQAKNLYNSSNKITRPQIEALNLLKSVSSFNDTIYSNISGVSETYHDQMVSDRYIAYFPTSPKNCINHEIRCLVFNSPDEQSSRQYFKENNINYFIFLKNNQEGNSLLDQLISKYQTAGYIELFSEKNVSLFKLP